MINNFLKPGLQDLGTPHGKNPGLVPACGAWARASHTTQRSNPGQGRDRRQYEKYGKVGQQRQEGCVRRAYWRLALDKARPAATNEPPATRFIRRSRRGVFSQVFSLAPPAA